MKPFIRRPIVIILGIVAIAALWLAFRPELLFVNAPVNDPFPTTSATTSASHL